MRNDVCDLFVCEVQFCYEPPFNDPMRHERRDPHDRVSNPVLGLSKDSRLNLAGCIHPLDTLDAGVMENVVFTQIEAVNTLIRIQLGLA